MLRTRHEHIYHELSFHGNVQAAVLYQITFMLHATRTWPLSCLHRQYVSRLSPLIPELLR